MTNHTNAVYVKNKIELSWSIRLGIDCDENQTRQLCDWSYRCSLRWKRNWAIVIDPKHVWSMAKTRQNNDVIDRTGIIHTENENELWSIGLGAIYDENQTGQQCDWLHRSSLLQKKKWTVETYLIIYSLWWKPNRTAMWSIIQVRSTPKSILTIMTDQTECHLWWKPNRTTTWSIVQVQSTFSWYSTIVIDRIGCWLWWKPDKITMWLIV